MFGFGEKPKGIPEKPEEEDMVEDGGAPIINEEPPMEGMTSQSQEAIADLEQQLKGGSPDLPPALSDEEAAAKLKKNTEDQMYSAAEKRQAKEKGG